MLSNTQIIFGHITIVVSLVGCAFMLYNAVSRSLDKRFKVLHDDLDAIVKELRTLNGRVTRLEVGLEDHKSLTAQNHAHLKEDLNRRLAEQGSEIRDLRSKRA